MSPAEAFRQRWQKRRRPALISVHRGLWGPLPENSHAAVTAAAKLGIVEIDVQMARDGVPVVHHDDTLARMTGRAERVDALEAAEIAGCRLREGAGGATAPLTDARVPTLSGLLRAAPDGAFFDFDCKHPEEVAPVAAILARAGAQPWGSVKIDVADADGVAELLDLQGRFGLMVMAKVVLPEGGPDLVAALAEAGVAATEVWFDDLGDLRAAAGVAGERMALSTYTLDPVHCCGLSDARAMDAPDAVWGRLIEAGIGVIMTDRAPDLARYLNSL